MNTKNRNDSHQGGDREEIVVPPSDALLRESTPAQAANRMLARLNLAATHPSIFGMGGCRTWGNVACGEADSLSAWSPGLEGSRRWNNSGRSSFSSTRCQCE